MAERTLDEIADGRGAGQAASLSDLATVATSVVSVELSSGATTPMAHGALGDGTGNDAAALAAAIATGQIVDLAGRTYRVITSVSVTVPDVTIRNGSIVGVLSTGLADTSPARSVFAASAAAAGLRLENVNVEGGHLACVFLTNGISDVKVKGGKLTPTGASQNSCGLMAAAGAAANVGIHVEGVEVDGLGGKGDGILLFDAQGCTVDGDCYIHDLNELPRLSWTSGWTVVSGNVYKRTDRTDGATRVLRSSSTYRAENTSTPTSPGSNEWGISGGEVYINLGGTDPNTVTVESRIVSGYGITIYTTTQNVRNNLIANNRLEDVDGFGIYYQLASFTCENNQTRGNRMRNVVTAGEQTSSLPFAGIGVNGGRDTLLDGDQINSSGHYGVWCSAAGSGRLVGVMVRGSAKAGFRAQTGDWSHDGCESYSNTENGFTCSTASGESFQNLEYNGCVAASNTLGGLSADNTAGTVLRLTVNGGVYRLNTGAGVSLAKCTDSFVGGGIRAYSNGSWQLSQTDTASARVVFADYHVIAGSSGVRFAGGTNCIHLPGTISSSVTTPLNGPGGSAPAVASATALVLPFGFDVISVTGTTTITSVTATGHGGRRATLVFAGVLTFTDVSNLKLAGDFVTSADDSITLVCDGTNWIETARSVN